jgi:transcriptional regulator with XRE-family HTH domain
MERAWVTSVPYRLMIDALVAARTDAGVGQRELARRLGKPPSWLNKIERLERRLDVLEFVAIARGIGVAPGALLTRMANGLPENFAL